MALKEIILFSVFVVTVNCQAGDPFGDIFNGFPGFPQLQFPQVPRFYFPQIPLPRVPSSTDLKNMKPGPGEVFHGISAISSSNLVSDKDGKLVQEGGSTVITNNNGKVDEYKTGNAPPDLNRPLKSQIAEKWSNFEFQHKQPKFQMPAFKPIKMPKMEKHQFKFPDLPDFPDHKFDGADGNDVKSEIKQTSESFSSGSSYSSSSDSKPKYFKYATSEFSNFVDNNGVKSSDAGSQTTIDDNGKVDKEKVAFNKKDKPEKE